MDGSSCRVLPQVSPSCSVQRIQVPVVGTDVHYTVSHGRRRKKNGSASRVLPCLNEIPYIVGVQNIFIRIETSVAGIKAILGDKLHDSRRGRVALIGRWKVPGWCSACA